MNYDETKEMIYDESNLNSVSKDGIKRGFFGYDYRQLQKDPNWKPDESKAVPLVMKPGQFMIFWSTLMHASYPHSGKDKAMRLGYAARYVPTSVKVYPHSDTLDEFGAEASLNDHGCVMVSGKDEYSHNNFKTATIGGIPFKTRQFNKEKCLKMDEIAQTIAKIWCEMFNIEKVKLDDDFFELGGDSLTAIKLISKTDELYGEDALIPDVLFENGTLHNVSKSIHEALAEATV